MKKKIGVVHVSAECQDCGKRFDSHKNGQALAAKHAKDYKHTVFGEICLAFEYDEKEGNHEGG